MSEEVKRHPAKFSNAVLDELNAYLAKDHPPWDLHVKTLYDPFAGIGKVFELERTNLQVYATELEWEWAIQADNPRMVDIDAFDFMRSLTELDGLAVGFFSANREHGTVAVPRGGFDYVVTSPTYGNRMADHHNAKDGSTRHTYKHYLGRNLSEMNSGQLQWGDEYRDFHRAAWRWCYKVTRQGGKILVNVKDHIRKGARQLVVDFHISALGAAGYEIVGAEKVDTPGMKHGENGEVRVDGEWIVIGRKN